MIELSVNLDHVATLRNARGGNLPNLLKSAEVVQLAGAQGITLHLREDRRHICDKDISDVHLWNKMPLNFEMAVTSEMIDIVTKINPMAICLVPENRLERTTEGGLDVFSQESKLSKGIEKLHAETNSRVSLFIEAEEKNVIQAKKLHADCIEFHTGALLSMNEQEENDYFAKLNRLARIAVQEGIVCHAGHGINYRYAEQLSKNPNISALNIGHFIISEAVFIGLEKAIEKMIDSMTKGYKVQK